jgi:hypothetical protein
LSTVEAQRWRVRRGTHQLVSRGGSTALDGLLDQKLEAPVVLPQSPLRLLIPAHIMSLERLLWDLNANEFFHATKLFFGNAN